MPRSDIDNAAALLFPSFNNPDVPFKFYMFLQHQTLTCIKTEFFIAILGLFITTFHLVVLTRKSVLTSSVISIMIGIAICDWISIAIVIGVKEVTLNFYRDECTPPSSYLTLRILYILLYIRDDVIRCSTWLSVLMALKRLLTLKSTVTGASSKTISFGFYAFGICSLLSSVMSTLSYLRTKTVEVGTWIPGDGCDIKPNEPPYLIYDQHKSGFFDDFWLSIFNFVNGFSFRIFPCILLPTLTVLLVLKIQELRKTTTTLITAVWKRTEKSTYLVILMSVTFLIANLPSGVFIFLQVIYTDIGFFGLSAFVDRFCNAISTLNASIHCIICFIMSSDYRSAVKTILRVQPKTQVSVSKF